jgi:hypothetical protein
MSSSLENSKLEEIRFPITPVAIDFATRLRRIILIG